MASLSQQRDKLDESLRRDREALLARRGDLEEQLLSIHDKMDQRMLEFGVRKTFLDNMLRSIINNTESRV